MGAIVAGGQARRFGADKALAQWRGRPLIEWAADSLARCDAIVMCGREWDGLLRLDDRPVSGLGPLGGIAAALAHAGMTGFAQVVTIGCDMPDVPATLIDALMTEPPAYCRDAPILGCWPSECADRLLAHLGAVQADGVRRDGRLSIRRWADAIGARSVAAPAQLRNVNTPADLT